MGAYIYLSIYLVLRWQEPHFGGGCGRAGEDRSGCALHGPRIAPQRIGMAEEVTGATLARDAAPLRATLHSVRTGGAERWGS